MHGEAASPNPGGTVRQLGEREIIRRLAGRLDPGRNLVVGIGDDAAVARAGGHDTDWVLTSDPVVEGVHFLPSDAPARVGRKAAGRVLSDLAAMGADALWLLVDLVAPGDMSAERLEAVYDGANALCRQHGAAIIGGDVSSGSPFQLHVFGVGRVPAGRALTRSGAQPGDALYVTGSLGGSLLGRHLDIQPRLQEGRWLATGGWASAALDVSDGLASDLFRLMEASRVGIRVEATRIPISDAASAMRDERDALDHALTDGEDFELLFSVRPEQAIRLEMAWKETFTLALTRIGEVTEAEAGPILVDRRGREHALRESGFEHYRSALEPA